MKSARRIIRVGTRGSLLALTQTNQVVASLRRKNPAVKFEICVIKTTGDEYQSVELFKKTNTGVFTKKIEDSLLANEIDIAVHSLKDLPTDLPPGLVLGAFPKRFDARDVLISRQKFTLKTLPKGALVGTGSPRRKRQLALLRPDVKILDIRGNLDTRIGRVLVKKDLHAVILAKAGLLRLKRYLKNAIAIPSNKMLPAVGQGALAIEVRAADAESLKIVAKLNHAPTQACVTAERSFLKALHGGCRVPVGINSKIKKDRIYLEAFVYSTQNDRWISGELSGPIKKHVWVGECLAKDLLVLGADKLMQEARQENQES